MPSILAPGVQPRPFAPGLEIQSLFHKDIFSTQNNGLVEGEREREGRVVSMANARIVIPDRLANELLTLTLGRGYLPSKSCWAK